MNDGAYISASRHDRRQEHSTPPAERLLVWFDRSRRTLPWRAAPGESADPYRVWLSEIMLQQTVVKAAAPYFLKFTALWPAVEDLSAAPLDDILQAWAGLGYYARARNLHACARTVVERHDGRFPQDETALLALPGIGRYTASAIRAIAFNAQTVPVDGNVERVMARYFNVETPLPAAKAGLTAHAQSLLPTDRPGDLAQALMDLGASLCSPRSPACALCPLSADCAGYASGNAASLPRKQPKKTRPVKYANAFVAVRNDGAVSLRKRPPKGLLGGMNEVPSSAWTALDEFVPSADAAPFPAAWQKLAGDVRHVFTHFELRVTVWRATDLQAGAQPDGMFWVGQKDLNDAALPSLMKKIVARGLQETAAPD